MNAKETELRRIVDTVIDCCATRDEDGTPSLTASDVLGNSRTENAVMTRCILVEMILSAGYSVGTAAFLLHRSNSSVRRIRQTAADFRATSRAYRIAEEEAYSRCLSLS